MLTQITKNLQRIVFSKFGSCVYIFKHDKKLILIDTGSRWNRSELLNDLSELKILPEDIDIVILTHNHFDHTGNWIIFKNAKIYGSKNDFKNKKITDIQELKLSDMELIETPGHSKGGICIYFTKPKILFSGDTLFEHGIYGRVDLPGSSPREMRKSLEKLTEINYKFLCPGHV